MATNRTYPVRQLTASGDEPTEKVSNLVKGDPTISTRRLSDEVGVSQTTVRRILRREKMNPY